MASQPLERPGMDLSPATLDMARRWFGYGRWDAPYWFVGVEPGGDDLDVSVRMWEALGKTELVDIAAHHEEGSYDWFGPAATTQPTWRALIWLLLTYLGEPPTRERTLQFQRESFGRIESDVASIELSSICAPSLQHERPRTLFREERILHIRNKLLIHKPRLVIFYSPAREHLAAWSEIAGRALERDLPTRIGETKCLVTYHPIGKWARSYWSRMGEALRED